MPKLEEDCIFCKIIVGKVKSWKVYENKSVIAFFDINPASEYHTLVIPKKHYSNIYEIDQTSLNEIMKAIKEITNLYKTKLGIENVNIINSNGKLAQQDVFHFHMHIIPRKLNDSLDIHYEPLKNKIENFDKLLEKIKTL
jgi:histidine triad (HIT) family protein